jgi:hypothetical protein
MFRIFKSKVGFSLLARPAASPAWEPRFKKMVIRIHLTSNRPNFRTSKISQNGRLTVEHVLLRLPLGPQVQEVGPDEQRHDQREQVADGVVLGEAPVRLGELPQQRLELHRPAARVHAVELERLAALGRDRLRGNQLLCLPAGCKKFRGLHTAYLGSMH